MEYKCDLRKEDKSVRKKLHFDLRFNSCRVQKAKSSFFGQNASVKQSLYDPAKILNSISKQRSQDLTSIYLRDN